MTKLTQEQIQTLEDAFNSFPEYMRTGTRELLGLGDSYKSVPHKSQMPF